MTIDIPCNIGDTVYYVRFNKDGRGWVTPYIVVGIHITIKRRGRATKSTREDYLVCAFSLCERSMHIPMREIGEKVFFTESEAESVAARNVRNIGKVRNNG